MTRFSIGVTVLLAGSAAFTQQSTHFRMEQPLFTSGGRPPSGESLVSPSFQISTGAVGDIVAGLSLTGPSFTMDPGVGAAGRPPAEVNDLSFAGPTTLAWSPDPSAGSYNLYRDLLTSLPALGYGVCVQQGIGVPTTMDATGVPVGSAWFYLVTAESRLGEEGTKGYRSNGSERQGSTCP